MTASDLHTLLADHHQFLLTDGDGDPLVDAHLPTDDALVTDESGQIAVRTGAHAAPVEIAIERAATEPVPLGQEWEDVVEFSARCTNRIALAGLFDEPTVTVVPLPGWHRLRVGAHGRDAGEQRGEVGARAKVVEHYLIQAWPAPPAEGVTIRATSLQPVDHTAGRVHLAPARAAAARIDGDLDRTHGHRELTGATGAAEAHWTYPASPRKLFRYMALPNLWTSATASGTTTPEVGAQYWLSNNDYRDIWDGIPTSSRGHLEATIVQIAAPRLVVSTWQWLDRNRYGQGQPILPRPTRVTVELRPTDDTSTTTVHVRHDDLPLEWVDDMTAIWLCKLEAGRDVYPIHR